MQIAWLPEPEGHPLWPDILRLLEPAVRADEPTLDPNEWVWIIFDGPTLYAAATSLMMDDGTARLRLAGGHRHRQWARLLNDTIEEWARDGGATRLFARGRQGWARLAASFGWESLGNNEYEKEL